MSTDRQSVRVPPARRLRHLACALLLAAPLAGQVPPGAQWIWNAPASAEPPEVAWLVAEFTLEHAPTSAQLGVAADNHARIFLNGKFLERVDEWQAPMLRDVTRELVAGRNVLAFKAWNDGGPAALLAFVLADGAPVFRTDATVRAFAEEPADWPAPSGGEVATAIAGYGGGPWGRLAWTTGRTLVPAEGFTCEEVATGFGSLIALELSPDGRPVVSVEDGGLIELFDEDGDGRFESSKPVCTELRACQGFCFDGLEGWATGVGPKGLGFYHLTAGRPRSAELIAPITGSVGEHGPHAVMLGPDRRVWIMLGNHVQLGRPFEQDSPVRQVYEGHVLPRLVDPNGHATEIAAPGGTIVAYDKTYETFSLQAIGFRNAYDMAFAPNGDLFTFDSDMEWDIGLPWYRPTRVVHVIPGGDYGWRTGSAVWPSWYPDSLPAAMDAGRGSPTGVAWCDSPAFPAAWRGTLLIGDWSQGRILGVHLTPEGITYRGRSEVLLSGRPLPVTDFVFDDDGSLLITVGGRGARGALLRLRGQEKAPAPPSTTFVAAARPPKVYSEDQLRKLADDPDRWVRWLAARGLEQRPVLSAGLIMENALAAKGMPLLGSALPPGTRNGEALLVAARRALAEKDAREGESLAEAGLQYLGSEWPLSTRLLATRTIELALLAGQQESLPGVNQPSNPKLGTELLPLFPSGSPDLDRELAALLARTEPPGARTALLAALDDEPSADGVIWLLYSLSSLRGAATAEETRTALEHFPPLRTRPGGASYQGYLDAIERRLVAQAPEADRDALRTLSRPAPAPAVPIATTSAPPRDPDRTRAYVEATLHAPERSAAEGALVFARTCAACHSRGEFSGRGGPDLSTVGARLQVADLLTAMLQPSRDISDQYRSSVLTLRDGRELSGVVVRDDGAEVELITGLGTPQTVRAEDVAERRFSRLSAMPDGLVDGLSLRALADLCAYLLATEPPPTPAASAWSDPLAGKDWETPSFAVRDGLARGTSPGRGGALSIVARPKGPARLELEARVPSGSAALRFDDRSVWLGGEDWGAIVGAAGVLAAADRLMIGPSLDPAGWNHVLIDLAGSRVRVAVNGIDVASIEQPPAEQTTFALKLEPNTPLAEFRLLRLSSPPP